MITAVHSILFARDPDAARDFFADVLELDSVDAGGGWLIFASPPSELAVHPATDDGRHELYLLSDDVEALAADLGRRGVACEPVKNVGWGMLTYLTLPGGGRLGVYQPLHARP